MSSVHEDDTQLSHTIIDEEIQETAGPVQSEDETQMDLDAQAAAAAASTTAKRKPKAPQTLTHTPGKSLFPVSRVQKILKADKELPMVSREAVMLISLATEEFVRRLSEASHRLAVRENRATVQRKDVASICRRADEFLFLEELIPLYDAEPATKRKPKALQQKDKAGEHGQTTLLDQFVTKAAGDIDEPPEVFDQDVVMNDDGTMTLDSL